MKYFEITTNASHRPYFIEDNVCFMKAKDLPHAVELFKANRGSMNITGDIVKVREVHCIYEFEK